MSSDGPHITQKIRSILMNEWDPISVGGNPNLADEYDTYIPLFIEMIERRCSVTELSKQLERIESSLGLSPPPEGRYRTAELLSLLDAAEKSK